MEIGKTLYVSERSDWRSWLSENFQTETEIWLVFPHKSTGKEIILYNDAVEEALCFGWIDSIKKKLDKDHAVQRFSPRNPKSAYSQANIERLRWLAEHNLLHSAVAEAIKPVINKEYIFPDDIISAIKATPVAWVNFQKFSPAYQRIRVGYIDNSRGNQEYFKKRLAYFIKKTEENKQYGYGGIEKYF